MEEPRRHTREYVLVKALNKLKKQEVKEFHANEVAKLTKILSRGTVDHFLRFTHGIQRCGKKTECRYTFVEGEEVSVELMSDGDK